jgi:hypothetical protein
MCSSAQLEDNTGARSGDRMDHPKGDQDNRVREIWSHLRNYTHGSEEEEFPGKFVAVPVSRGHQGIFRQRIKKNGTISAISSGLACCVPVCLRLHTIVSNGEPTKPCLLGKEVSGSRTT